MRIPERSNKVASLKKRQDAHFVCVEINEGAQDTQRRWLYYTVRKCKTIKPHTKKRLAKYDCAMSCLEVCILSGDIWHLRVSSSSGYPDMCWRIVKFHSC